MKVIATSDEIMHQTPNTVLSSIADKMEVEGQIDVNHDGTPDIGWRVKFQKWKISFECWLISKPDKNDWAHFLSGLGVAIVTLLVKEYLL